MGFYDNLDGTLKDEFSIGSGSNKVNFKTVAGIVYASDNDGVFHPVCNVNDTTLSDEYSYSNNETNRLLGDLTLAGLKDVSLSNLMVDEAVVWNGNSFINKSIGSVAASSGVSIYLDNTPSIGGYQSLLRVPNTSTPEQTLSVTITGETAFMGGFMYNQAENRTKWEGGTWRFNNFCYVSSKHEDTEIISGIYRVQSLGGTLATTGTGTTRTVNITRATPFVAGDHNSDQIQTSYIQTSTGTFPIASYVSSSQVTITTPSGYVNQSGISYTIHRYKFQSTTGFIDQEDVPALYSNVVIQPEYSLDLTDTLAQRVYAKTTSTNNITVYLTYNDSIHYSYVETPFQQRHDELAGLNLPGTNYRHLSNSEYTSLLGIIATPTHVEESKSTNQGITGGVATKLTFNTEDLDVDGEFTGNTFTSKSAQTLSITAYATWATSSVTNDRSAFIYIYKNGSPVATTNIISGSNALAIPCNLINWITAVDIGDTIEIYVSHNDGTSSRNITKAKLSIAKIS